MLTPPATAAAAAAAAAAACTHTVRIDVINIHSISRPVNGEVAIVRPLIVPVLHVKCIKAPSATNDR